MWPELVRASLVIALALPAVGLALFAAGWLVGLSWPERAVTRLSVGLASTSALAALGGTLAGWWAGVFPLEAGPFPWFGVEGYHFELAFRWDLVSLVMVDTTTLLCALVIGFSVDYLHRERGVLRFFVLLLLFSVAMQWLVVSESFDQLFLGWELVGVSSILLVAFFSDRSQPVAAAIRVMVTYRVCDLGLLIGTVLMHQQLADTSFVGVAEHLTPGPLATLLGLLLLLSASGKAAQLPVGTWLPKAMEGPTPSSALFYGALSVHAGIYLLIRAAPIFERSVVASVAAVVVGSFTSLVGSLLARVQSDAKSSLAWASMSQLGLMVVEVGLHLPMVALVHLVGHAALRGVQLLKAPQLLHDGLGLRRALGSTSLSFDARPIPLPLFRFLRDGLFLDLLMERFVVRPLVRAGEAFGHVELAWARWVTQLSPFLSKDDAPDPAEPEERQ